MLTSVRLTAVVVLCRTWSVVIPSGASPVPAQQGTSSTHEVKSAKVTASAYPCICLCLSLYLSLSISVSLTRTISLCLCFCLSVSFSVCLCVCLTAGLSLYLSVRLSLCLPLCVSLSGYVFLSHMHPFPLLLMMIMTTTTKNDDDEDKEDVDDFPVQMWTSAERGVMTAWHTRPARIRSDPLSVVQMSPEGTVPMVTRPTHSPPDAWVNGDFNPKLHVT